MTESASPEAGPIVGDVIAGKYRIDSVAGEGGMGIVYEAEHVILRQRVAIKVVLPSTLKSPEAAERFLIEARAAARITCEHVVRVMDAGSLSNGAPYLVMEFLEGCDLKGLLDRKRTLPVAEVVDYALQGLEALAHAHTAGVIHRDLKPANLFLATCADGRQIIKMLDFGISKSLIEATDGRLTGQRVLGSPVYMSPEQLRNAQIDPRADLWSLGVVIYELLVGTTPFNSTNIVELIAAILEREATPLCERNANISPAFSEIVATCLRRDPNARWANSGELARALAPYGSGAWAGAVERIDRVLSRPAPKSGVASGLQRRFDSFETALHALDGGADNLGRVNRSAEQRSTVPPDEEEDLGVVVTHLPEGPESSSERSTLRIVLIDDQKLAQTVHEHQLRAVGFDVRATSSKDEDVEAVLSWKPSLVVIDVHDPEACAALCRRIKTRRRSLSSSGVVVPIVLVSDLAREVLQECARVSGADAFLSMSKSTTASGPELVDFVKNICAITYSPEALPEA